MFSKPFRATCTIFESISVRRSHKGLMQPSSTRCLRRRSKHCNISHLSCWCRKWSDHKWHVKTRFKKWSPTWSAQLNHQMWRSWWPTPPPFLSGTQLLAEYLSTGGANLHPSPSACYKDQKKECETERHSNLSLCIELLKHAHTCICARFPAVILEMVQHASFLMDSFGLLSRWRRLCRAEQLRITCLKENELHSKYVLATTLQQR